MAEPLPFDDPGPPTPKPPSRGRRAATVAVLITLVVSIVVLAFVSGRGVVTVAPDPPQRTAIAPSAATGSRLAVIDAAGRLTTTDAAGGSVVPYGENGIVFSFPAWSPDGARIAVIGTSAADAAVYVFAVPADGGAAASPSIVYRSSDRPPFYLYWSPDGRQVTFLTTEPSGLALRLVPADASAPAVIVREGSPMYWAWADPARLLVHSGGGGPSGFFAEIGTDGVSLEANAIEPGGFRAPAVTADGRYRAFVAPGGGSIQRVVIEGRDRSNQQSLDVFGAAAIEFGPATADLAFIAPAEAGREVAVPVGPLRLMDAVSGKARTVLGGPVVAFFWSPDGRTLAALQVGPTSDDQVATTGAGANITLARAPGRPFDARRLAAPGLPLRVVFVNAETGAIGSQRSLVVAETFTGQLLPFFDQYGLSHRIWSADGTSVVIPVVADDGTGQLLVVRADGSEARPIADGVAGFWSP